MRQADLDDGKRSDGFTSEETDLFALSAVYANAITRDHPFRDGNKSLAVTAAAVFLELNGYRFQARQQEVVHFTEALSARQVTEDQFAEWLRRSSRRFSRRRRSR